MSPSFHTVVAQQFLSAIVIQFIQSQLTVINHRVGLWNTHAHVAIEPPSTNIVHVESGATFKS